MKFTLSFGFLLILFLFPAFALRELTVDFFTHQDTTLKARLWLPDSGARLPAIVLLHEGGFRDGDMDCFSSYSRYLTDKGFAAMGVGYRLMRQGGGFPRSVRDVFHAYLWLSAHAREFGIDSTRLWLFGSSAGAYLAAMTLVGDSLVRTEPAYFPDVRFECAKPAGAVLSYGIYDWKSSRWKGDGFLEQGDWERASPLRYAASVSGRILLFAGKQDPLFGTIQAETFGTVLKRAGCQVEIIIRPDGGHGGVCQRRGVFAQWEAPALDLFLNDAKQAR